MHIGMIGLGRMGGNMMERLRDKGLEVTGFDRNEAITEVPTLEALVETLPQPRVIWVMVPAGVPTNSTIDELADLLDEGDIIIEGGNSNFMDDIAQAEELKDRGIHYLDCGVSGGIWGRSEGYGLMVGGEENVVQTCMPLFDALRPEGPREIGFSHPGPVGAGHYAKMIHNGIEYGMMQAYAEGFELLAARPDLIKDVSATFTGWQRGTVVRSWLLDLMVRALEEDPELDDLAGYVDDSGEGRWTVIEAVNNAVPAPVISAALFSRFVSRQDESPAMRAVAALRNQFGGHAIKPAE